MHLAGSSRYFVHGQIDVVSGSGRHAPGGGELIGNRTDRRVLQWHGGLQRFGWIMLRRFVHHLYPDGQRQCRAIAVRNDRGRLIEPDPHAAGECAGITDKPGVLVIISGAGLTCRRQSEAQRARARSSALGQNFLHQARSHPGRTGIKPRRSDVRREINRFVSLIVDALDDVRLFTYAGIRKNSISGSQIFQVRLERPDVDRGTVGNILGNPQVIRDFLHRIKTGELGPRARSWCCANGSDHRSTA